MLAHALFKALLFLCAGALIHRLLNFQDIRVSGGFINQVPLTLASFNISNLALCGIPFLSGFYSKDLILEILIIRKTNLLIFFLFFISTGLTVIYTFRLIYYRVSINLNIYSLINMNDLGWGILKPLVGLTFVSIFGGRCLRWLIFPMPLLVVLPFFLKRLVLIVCIMGGGLGYFIFRRFIFYYKKFGKFNLLVYFFSLIWFIPSLSTVGVNKKALLNGISYQKRVDFGWNEILGGGFLALKLTKLSINLMSIFYNNYFKGVFISVVLLIFLLIIIN